MNHVLCGLAANPALPSGLVDRLIAIADDEIGWDLAWREDLNRGQAVALASHVEGVFARLVDAGLLTAGDIDPMTRPLTALALLSLAVGDPEWARRMAADPVVDRREKLAACPGLPPDVVEALATDLDIRVIAELALWTTPEMAARLAWHPHAEVRGAVAANEATPPAVLAALITGDGPPPAQRCLVCDREEVPFTHDPHCPRLDCDLLPGDSCDGSHESTVHEMQLRALGNPATPAEAVTGFADHPSMLLREQLAARPDLPPEMYRRLADDPIPGVRAALARNPAIGDALTRVLATDRGHDVQRSLAHNAHVPLDVLTGLAGATKIGLTLLPRIAAASPAEVKQLAASPSPVIRMLLAQRRDLPPSIRDALATDPDASVVKSVAPHPGLSDVQLRAMVDRHGARVVAKVARNPGASPALLEALTRRVPPVQKVFREVAAHPNATAPSLLACLQDRRARRAAAGHPALPPSVIIELLRDDDPFVVEAAAANPALPPAVMSGLVP